MLSKKSILGAAVALALAASGSAAFAAVQTVNLSGFKSFGGFSDPSNSSLYFSLPKGSLITGFSYSGLTVVTSGDSLLSEFTLSVNDTNSGEFLDWAPITSFGGGTLSGVSGTWNGPTGHSGVVGAGAAFALSAGPNNLWVTVYESYDDNGLDALDATVTAGTLTINYTPAVPEPSTYALMALGLAGLGVVARRRRQNAA